MRQFIVLIFVLVFAGSCELQKRHYTKGFYVLFLKREKKVNSKPGFHSEQAVKEETSRELKAEQTVLAEKVEKSNEQFQLILPTKKKLTDKIPLRRGFSHHSFEKKENKEIKIVADGTKTAIEAKIANDTGFTIALTCFAAFVILFVFGWMLRVMLLEFFFLALLFLLLLAVISGISVAGIAKSLRHIFSTDAMKTSLAVIALILAGIVILGFLSMLTMFMMF